MTVRETLSMREKYGKLASQEGDEAKTLLVIYISGLRAVQNVNLKYLKGQILVLARVFLWQPIGEHFRKGHLGVCKHPAPRVLQ